MPIILHVDMDAFYAAVEEREHPELRGKPIVVGADPKGGAGRGVVSTCNYAARKFGVHSAMPISIAYRKCPECVFLSVNMELYVAVSQRVMSILRAYADKMEQVSIDEAYLDVTHSGSYEKAKALAQKIKQEIREKEGLSCSVGIGPNKLVAKVASDFQKPDGLTVVPPEKVLAFLGPLDVRALRGVGPKTQAVLRQQGIRTVGDLRTRTKAELTQALGSFGDELYRQARGVYPAEIVTGWTIKSIGRQGTFEQDTRDQGAVLGALDEMILDVWKQLNAEGMVFKTVTIKVRYSDFSTHTKSKTLIAHTDSIDALRTTVRTLLLDFLKDERNIRLVGVSVHNLKQKE